MQHGPRLASSRSALCFFNTSVSLYKPLLLILRSLSKSSSPSSLNWQKAFVYSTTTDRESPESSLPSTSASDLDSDPEDTQRRGLVTFKHAAKIFKRKKADEAKADKAKAARKKADRKKAELKHRILNLTDNLVHNLGDPADSKMRSYIQFLTTPTSDTPGTALLLHFDDKRYIIGNVHEGLQRACLQLGARVYRCKDMLLTGRTEWQSNGGLLGMILTLADAANASASSRADTARLKLERKRRREEEESQRKKKKKLDAKADDSPPQATPTPWVTQSREEDPTVRLHGGPNLTHTLATARSFVFRKGVPIKVFEHIEKEEKVDNEERDCEPTWSDSRIRVWAMPINPAGAFQANEGPKPDSIRKRSLGEFMTGKGPSQQEVLDQWSITPENQEERNQQIREFAVSEMFSSAWSHDNLTEKPLRNVKMPATLFVRDPITKELTRYEGPKPDGTAPVPDVNVLVRQAWPGALVDHLPSAKRSSTAMSYIIRNHSVRGKFRRAAAIERKIPRGYLWAALASGSSVQSDDGITVTPDMVLEPGKEGSGVAVVDLPTSEYVHDLVNRAEWRSEKVMSGVEAVVWILGPGVVHDQKLLNFIKGQPGVQHIISSPDRCPDYLPMISASFMAIRHSQIDPARYAIPVHSNAVPARLGDLSDASETFKLCKSATRGLRVQLEPKFEVTEEKVVPVLNTARVVQETSQIVLKLSQAAIKEISSPAAQAELLSQNLPSPDAEIITLGTGSASPSQYRNVSATLLRVPGCGSYLMDCGENTLGQLKRMYTAPQLAELLQDLKLIWISHLHADHHLGLTSVIKAWYKEVHGKDEEKRRRPTLPEQMSDPAKFLEEGKRLFVVGHEHLSRWLEEYSSVEDFGYDQLVPLVSFPINMRANDLCSLEWNGVNVGFNVSKEPKIKAAIRKATGLSNLISCAVMHCWGAQAVSLTFPTGFKFSYSGDCRPSKTFAEIGKYSTVLVHEATFDDELKSDAIAKKHSTTSEAIGVGVAMGARRVLLTHFSQRYQAVPSLSALDHRSVELEDAEDVDDPSAGMDRESTSPVKPEATINSILDGLDETPSNTETEPYPQAQTPPQTSAPGLTASDATTLAQTIASNNNPTPRPQLNDMKIGVAFDYMRVKVGDIMHLEKFTPALQELYKDTSDEKKDARAAEDAFADDENDVLKREQGEKVGDSEERMKEERAEKARKGQIKAARKKQEIKDRWEKEEREKDEKSERGEGRLRKC